MFNKKISTILATILLIGCLSSICAAQTVFTAYKQHDEVTTRNNYVEYLYTALIENDCDISTCSKVISSSDNVTFDDQDTVCVQSMDGKACCKALLTSDIYDDLVTAWGKVYRRKIIEDTPFPVGHIHEDEAVTPIIMYSARKVLYSNRRLYCYFVNEESIMHTRGTKKNLDAIWAMKSRAEYFDEKGEIELSRLSWEKLYSYLMLDSINYAGRCDEELRVNITKSRVSRKVYYCLLIYRLCPRIYKLIWKSTHKR